MCNLITPFKNINSIVSTISQLPIVHVSTESLGWCDRFSN